VRIRIRNTVKKVHYFMTLIFVCLLAIAMIKTHPRPITSYKEAAALRGVGAKMAQKIMEILDYGKLSKVICVQVVNLKARQ
jgi:hypothetical protein